MRERKDIEFGRDLSPGQAWAVWVGETQALVKAVLISAKVRLNGVSDEEIAPAN